MTTVADLVLLTTDPESGKSRIGSVESDAAIGGAILVDLIRSGRVDLSGEGRRARATILDAGPISDAVVASAFDRVRGRRPMRPSNLVTKLGKHGRNTQYDALVADGTLQQREAKVLGLFPARRYTLNRPEQRDAIVSALQDVLLRDRPADERTGPLAGLLHAAGLLKVVVPKPDLKRAKARADAVSDGDWASKAVRDAIKAAQAAVTAATVAATSAAAAGS